MLAGTIIITTAGGLQWDNAPICVIGDRFVVGASMHVVPKYRSFSTESIVLRTLNNLRQQLPVNAEEAMLALQIAKFFSLSAGLI